MSVDLMDQVQSVVGSRADAVAALLGENAQTTSSVVQFGTTAIVWGLIQKSASNVGATKLWESLDDHDGGLIENLDGLLGGGNQAGLLDQGAPILSALFAGGDDALAATIAKLSGVEPSKVNTILAMLAPIVMGVLGKIRRTQGLDVSGLTDLLRSYKGKLSTQTPAELAASLGLPDLSGHREAAAETAKAKSTVTAAATTNAGDKPNRNLVMTFLPLVILACLAFFAFRFFNGKPEADAGGDDLPGEVTTAPKIDLPGFDANAIDTAFGGLSEAIAAVRNVESARQVLPLIGQAKALIEPLDLKAISEGAQREPVSQLFSGLIIQIRISLDRAYAIPGVREIIDPVIRPFLNKFDVLGI